MSSKNKKRNKISVTAIALIALTAFLFAGSVLYAYFSADRAVDTDYTAVSDLEVNIKTNAGESAVTTFRAAGDKFTADVTVTNRNAYAVSYGFRIDGIANAALTEALILRFDGTVVGSLAKCADKSGNILFDEEFLLAPPDQGVNASRTHAIELELHNGAGNLFSEIENRVSIFVTAKSYVNPNTIFVKSAEEFLQAVRPETLAGAAVKTVQLQNDIDLSRYEGNTSLREASGSSPARTASDLIVENPVRIDLNGKKLKLNTGLFFAYADGKESTVTSGFAGGKVEFNATDVAAGLVAETPDAFVSFGDKGSKAENVSVTPVTIAAISEQKLADAAAKYAQTALKKGVSTQTIDGANPNPIDIAGGYGYYASDAPGVSGRLNVTLSPEGLAEIRVENNTVKLNAIGGLADSIPANFLLRVQFTVGGTTSARAETTAKLIAGDDLADEILREFNAYFYREESGVWIINDLTAVSRDLYLPMRVTEYNAEIEWISSDPGLLTDTGKYRPDMFDRAVTLTAIVSFEGRRVNREFKVNVAAFSAAERLKLMLAAETVVFTKSPDRQALAFDTDRYQLENLSYVVAHADQKYLEIAEETNAEGVTERVLKLKSSPADTWSTEITVTANGTGETEQVTAKLKILVNIERSVSIVDEANRYAQTFMPGNRTFASFNVPTLYNETVTIGYEVPAGTFAVAGNNYVNDAEIGNYIKILAEDPLTRRATLQIDPSKVPTENSVVYLRVSYTYAGTSEQRVVSFQLNGILHNNDAEIKEFALYVKLLNAVDKNGDLYLTRDEADAAEVSELAIVNAGLTSLKGIEYFNLNGTLNVSYNKLTDIAALAGMRDLKRLDLSYNLLNNVSALENCTSLVYLNLASNSNLSDVSSLENLAELTELYLNGASRDKLGVLTDISSIRSMANLKSLSVYFNAVTEQNNRNAILTAYFNYFNRTGTYPDYKISSTTKFNPTAANREKYKASNDAVNAIAPIYEFANVIYLPPTSGGFNVSWRCYPEELFARSGDNVIVNQPLADIDAKITAEILVGIGTESVVRTFQVLSRGNNMEYTVETSDGVFVSAAQLIPDANLRYLLFNDFDRNGDRSISYAELTASPQASYSYNNQNIKDLSGIEYFSGITNLDLSDNPFTDPMPLNRLKLVTLTIHNGRGDLQKFEPENADGSVDSDWKYTLLDFYGSDGLNDAGVVEQLLHLYNNHLTSSGKIYKDNKYAASVSGKEWKPYDDELKRVATNMWGVITLKSGEDWVTLPTSYTWLTENDLAISYNQVTGVQTASKYTLSSNKIRLTYANAPSVDVTAFLNVTVKYTEPVSKKTYSVSVYKLIFLQTNTELEVEIDATGNRASLNAMVSDSAARRQIVQAVGEKAHLNGDLITRAMLTEMVAALNAANKPLTFASDSAEGLAGLKIFEGTGLQNLKVLYGSEYAASDGAAVPYFEQVGSVADTLTTLTIERTFADLTKLPILPNLNTLTLLNCPKIVMTSGEAGAVSVFDQSVADAKFPSLTKLVLNDNYITSAVPLRNLRTVKDLTLYNNPASRSALTESVVAEIYENLSDADKADYRFYVAGAETLWGPNSNVANTVTGAGATLNGTELSPDVYGVNYASSGDVLTLPSEYSVNGTPYRVEWTTVFSDTVVVSGGQAELSNAHDATAYVSIEAYFPSLSKTIVYYLAVKGSKTLNDKAQYVDFDLFETVVGGTETAIADPYFLNYCFDLLKRTTPDNRSGLYAKTAAESVTEIALSNSITKRNYAVASLKGIENFTNLRRLAVNYNAIDDLTPIANLTSLEILEVAGNRLTDLYLADGKTSVFYKLDRLKDLRIGYNNDISDFKPIVYATYTDGTGTERTGLDGLKSLFLQDVTSSANSWNNRMTNETDWVKTLSVWLDAVKGGDGNYDGVTLYTIASYYTSAIQDSDALKHLAGSAQILLADQIPDRYTAVREASGNYVVQNIVKTVSSSTGDGYLYTVDYAAVTAQDANFINVGATSITIQNVASITIGGKMVLRATVYVNTLTDWKIYKEIELDTSVLNESASAEALPLIEVNDAEKSAYLGAGTGLADADFTAEGNGKFLIKTEKLVPDYAFARYLYTLFDGDADKIITETERASAKAVNVDRQGVTDIRGLELFANITNLRFSQNRLTVIPQFVALPYTAVSEFGFSASEDYLYDISGLLTLKSADGSYRIVSLDLSSCGALGQDSAETIGKLPLTRLSLTSTSIYDFKFIADDLSDTLLSVNVGVFNRGDHDYPGYEAFYGFREAFTRLLFETPAYNEEGLVLASGNTTIVGFDETETYLYPYLNAVKTVKKDGKTVALDQSFEAFGKTYQVRYSLVGTATNITLDGYNLTVNSKYSGSSFVLLVQAGVKKTDGSTVWTFRQETPFYFEAAEEDGAAEIADDCEVYAPGHSAAVGDYAKLSAIVPDQGLRAALIAVFDKNSDGKITEAEMKSVASGNVNLVVTTATTGLLANVAPAPIGSFEGIGFFKEYLTRTLQIYGANTADLSPLGDLENVTTLNFNATNYIFLQNDANGHSNVTDWSFVAGMKKLNSIFIVHTNTSATGLESIVDSKSLTVINSYNENVLFVYSTVANAIAFGQSRNDLSDYLDPTAANKNNNLLAGTREDQKKASVILSTLNLKMKEGSEIRLADGRDGEVLRLPNVIEYQNETFAVEYIPLTTNLAYDPAENTLTMRYLANYTKAKFVARIRMNGGLYERMLELEVAS